MCPDNEETFFNHFLPVCKCISSTCCWSQNLNCDQSVFSIYCKFKIVFQRQKKKLVWKLQNWRKEIPIFVLNDRTYCAKIYNIEEKCVYRKISQNKILVKNSSKKCYL